MSLLWSLPVSCSETLAGEIRIHCLEPACKSPRIIWLSVDGYDDSVLLLDPIDPCQHLL